MQDEKKRGISKGIFKAWLVGLGLFAIFSFGYGLGSGNLKIGVRQSKQNSQLSSSLDFASVEKVYDLLRNNFDGQLDFTKLTDGMKQGLVNAIGDPHTEFMTVEQTKEFNDDLNGTFSGIGAELSKEKDMIVVVSPISGFPAEKAGLKAKDAIVEVDGENTYGLSLTEVVSRIRGPEGTDVKLRVVRNQQEDLKFTIKRANITIASTEGKMLENNTGYIKITRFSDDTTQLTRDLAKTLKQQGAKDFILDLRGNPGGLLDSAVDVSSIWLSSGKTVLQEKRDGVVIKTYKAKGNALLEGVPTIVLIDGSSASASEIVAGALRDNNASKLLGVKSYGKGSVQTVEELADGSSLKVTVAHWFTPNGQTIDKQGLDPDIKVESSSDSESDVQLKSAQEELLKQR